MRGQIRTGVVGLGYFGSFHARHYAAIPGSQLAALVDADHGRASELADRYSAPFFTDHRELIGKVDAVSIVVPTSLHHAVAGDLLDAGIHVLVEKPITDQADAARDLVARADRAGVVLQVGHIERHSATFKALRRQVERPVVIDCRRTGPWKGRATDVDVVLDVMIHDIDLALALAGAPVVRVSASGAPVVSRTVDVAEARLEFANGVVAELFANRVAERTERVIQVVEADRLHIADLYANRITVSAAGGETGVASQVIEVDKEDALGNEIAGFLGSIAGKARPEVDGQAGLDALVVADRILSEIAGNPRLAADDASIRSNA
jgi:predicted dehydrogenase